MEYYLYSLSNVNFYPANSEYNATSNRADYYAYFLDGNFEVPPEDFIVITNGENVPVDYYPISTIYLYETTDYLDFYKIDTASGTIDVGTGTFAYKSDVDWEHNYNYFNHTKVTGTSERKTNIDIDIITASFDIYKGVLTHYLGNYTYEYKDKQNNNSVETTNYEVANSNGGQVEYQTDSSSIETTFYEELVNTPVAILPNFQELITKQIQNTSGLNKQYHFETGSNTIETETSVSSSSEIKKQTNLAQVYIPKTGQPTCFIKKSEYSSEYSYPNDTTPIITELYKGYLLNYATESITDHIEDEINLLRTRKTNLIKNVFYVSPVEKENIDPELGLIIEPPEYLNKNLTIEGDKYTVESSGVITKTNFKDKIFSLKITPQDNYTVHGISYYPPK